MVDHVSREHARPRTGARTLLNFPAHALDRFAPALALCALLSGCGAGDAASGARAPAGAAAREPVIVPAGAADLLQRVRTGDARVTVLNVWATWCGPCREEFPDLLRLREAYRESGLDLMLVTGDFDEQLEEARAFLASHDVDFETFIKTGRDMEFINTLNPEWSGALPATFVFDGEGRRRDFWEGKASFEEMEQRVLPVLGDAVANR